MRGRKVRGGIFGALALLLGIGVLAGVIWLDAKKGGSFTASSILMSTVVTVNVEGQNAQAAGEAVLGEIKRLEEAELSRHAEGSSVSAVNANAGDFAQASELTVDVCRRLEELRRRSGGAFNPLLGAVSDLWGFGSSAAVPQSGALSGALEAAGGNMEFFGTQIKIPKDTVLDLGSVGKGIACDSAKKILAQQSAARAVISVGGSILLYGEGESFTVGVRDPYGEQNAYMGVLTLGAGCVSTSGSYERYFDLDGKRYHHILDPATGFPAESGLLSVTVVCSDGFLSDALSTACFVLGYEDSKALLQSYGAEAVFIFENRETAVTDGLKDLFEISDKSYTIK